MKRNFTIFARNIQSILALVLVAASLGACYETTYDKAIAALNAGGSPPPTTPPPTTPPPTSGFGANFSEIQASVFTPTCATSGCHVGVNPAAGLNLDTVNSYAMLVGVQSTQAAGTQRVNPTNPTDSYLIQKLEGTAASGGQMPPSGALPQADINTIRQWISAGAIDDRGSTSTPIRVLSLSVTAGGTLTTAPDRIIAGFDRELDASTVNANTFILEASNNDGIFDNGNDVAIAAASISVPITNTQSAVFDLTGVPLANDTYRVRLLGSGASFIMDLDTNALNGEFSGAFPSGNSAAGGDFEARFMIAVPAVIGATLDEIQAAVFTPSCATAGCHDNTTQAAGLSLANADTSYAELVGEFSNQNGQSLVLLVAPTDPGGSYLIRKMEDAAGITGARMPLNAAAVPQPDIDLIRQWILDGAMR